MENPYAAPDHNNNDHVLHPSFDDHSAPAVSHDDVAQRISRMDGLSAASADKATDDDHQAGLVVVVDHHQPPIIEIDTPQDVCYNLPLMDRPSPPPSPALFPALRDKYSAEPDDASVRLVAMIDDVVPSVAFQEPSSIDVLPMTTSSTITPQASSKKRSAECLLGNDNSHPPPSMFCEYFCAANTYTSARSYKLICRETKKEDTRGGRRNRRHFITGLVFFFVLFALFGKPLLCR